VDTEGNRLTRRLLLNNTLDVYDVLETVDGSDLALTALVGASDNEDFVILSDWDGADLGIVRRERRPAEVIRTLYFSRSSLLRGALMMVRLTLEGAAQRISIVKSQLFGEMGSQNNSQASSSPKRT
jgi:hypothetical protein